MSPLIKYTGSCHCGTVKYEVLAPTELQVFHCKCSICTKKQIDHFLVSSSTFKLLSGHTELSPYTFGTHRAKHLFCSKCGVQSFFIPKCSQEAMAIVTHCVDSPLPLKCTKEQSDVGDWEAALQKLNISLDSSNVHQHS